MTSAAPRLKGLAAIAATSFATAALAGLPTGTLTFVTPSGTVGPTDTVNIWMRFTLDANSAPLNFFTDPQTGLLSGFDTADLPTKGYYWAPGQSQPVESEFAQYTGATFATARGCNGDSFTNQCNPSAANYSFKFLVSSQPGLPSIVGVDHVSLAPGQSIDYVFGQFTPRSGGAADGSYAFYGSSLSLRLTGKDAAGHDLFLDTLGPGPLGIGSACPTFTADCAFTRTVAAVPEPGSYGLMVLGLGVVGLRARRKGRQAG